MAGACRHGKKTDRRMPECGQDGERIVIARVAIMEKIYHRCH
jgi:hypothetical protein